MKEGGEPFVYGAILFPLALLIGAWRAEYPKKKKKK